MSLGLAEIKAATKGLRYAGVETPAMSLFKSPGETTHSLLEHKRDAHRLNQMVTLITDVFLGVV